LEIALENRDPRSTPDKLIRDLLTSLGEYIGLILQCRVGDPRSTLEEFVIGIIWRIFQFKTELKSVKFEINL
jgi:hypothetical protein